MLRGGVWRVALVEHGITTWGLVMLLDLHVFLCHLVRTLLAKVGIYQTASCHRP
jgi:hypothetical protein